MSWRLIIDTLMIRNKRGIFCCLCLQRGDESASRLEQRIQMLGVELAQRDHDKQELADALSRCVILLPGLEHTE